MMSARILHPVGEQRQGTALGQNLLHTLVEEQLAFDPLSVRQHGIAQLVVGVVRIEVRRHDDLPDAAGGADVLDGDLCRLTQDVMIATDRNSEELRVGKEWISKCK